MIAVGRAAESTSTELSQRTVRIAALHHQIFPLSPTDEVKPFETKSNLDEFRTFLADNAIDSEKLDTTTPPGSSSSTSLLRSRLSRA
jgi:hypothetical protein